MYVQSSRLSNWFTASLSPAWSINPAWPTPDHGILLTTPEALVLRIIFCFLEPPGSDSDHNTHLAAAPVVFLGVVHAIQFELKACRSACTSQ